MSRPVSIAGALALIVTPALATPAPAKGPDALGTFDAWQVWVYPEARGRTCTMVARPVKTEPAGVAGTAVGKVGTHNVAGESATAGAASDGYLTIFHRQIDRRIDQVAVAPGHPTKKEAPVTLQVGRSRFELR